MDTPHLYRCFSDDVVVPCLVWSSELDSEKVQRDIEEFGIV